VSDVIEVKKRDETGTLRMRRLRKAGRVPAIVYGRGLDCVHISIDSRDVDKLMKSGRHIVELGGDVSENTLVKEVQWDAFGTEVVHMDLARIDVSEAVEVSLNVELRGVAPGTRAGGIVKHQLHEIMVRCPADQLPEHLVVNINELELDDIITAADVELPASAELLVEPGEVVVTCVAPTIMEEDLEEGEAGMAEPEVIGRKPEDEEGEGGSS